MRELGMPFSKPLVPKVRRREKTVTRRIVSPQPRGRVGTLKASNGTTFLHDWDGATGEQFFCPYGRAGDHLWVRESIMRDGDGIRYAADGVAAPGLWRWKPRSLNARYLPKELARTWLEVLDVRVERLQEITEADAIAEGVEAHDDDGVTYYGPLNHGHASAVVAFERLWSSLHGAESWTSNPWVWRIAFRLLEQKARAA